MAGRRHNGDTNGMFNRHCRGLGALAAMIAVIAVLTACSSEPTAVPAESVDPETTDADDLFAAAPDPETDEPSAQGASTTSSTSPTTQTAPESADDDLRRTLQAVAQADESAWFRCIADPAACDVAEEFAATKVIPGESFDFTVNFINQASSTGTVYGPPDGSGAGSGDGLDNTILPIIQTMELDPDGQAAVAEICGRNDWAAFLPGNDGELTLVPGSDIDEIYRNKLWFRKENDTWKVESIQRLETVDANIGESSCEFDN